MRAAAALGIAAVHECGGPGTSSEDDFCALLALPAAEPLPEVYGYWGELGAAAKARQDPVRYTEIVRPGAASNRSMGCPNRAGGATMASAGPPQGAPMAVA